MHLSCLVDGRWSRWSSYTSCTSSCGGGTQTRTRECNSPAPALGGKTCTGSKSETRQCNTNDCAGKRSCVVPINLSYDYISSKHHWTPLGLKFQIKHNYLCCIGAIREKDLFYSQVPFFIILLQVSKDNKTSFKINIILL